MRQNCRIKIALYLFKTRIYLVNKYEFKMLSQTPTSALQYIYTYPIQDNDS